MSLLISKHVGELVAAAVAGKEIEWCWANNQTRHYPFYGKVSDLEDPKKLFRVAAETENRVRYRLALTYVNGSFQIEAVNSATDSVAVMKDPNFVEWYSDWLCEDIPESKAPK